MKFKLRRKHARNRAEKGTDAETRKARRRFRLRRPRRVTIPSIMPGIMSAAFLSFTLSIDDVIMSNMLASASQSTLPVLILSVNRTGITPDINALVTLVTLVMVAGMLTITAIQKTHARRDARLMKEAERRISAGI